MLIWSLCCSWSRSIVAYDHSSLNPIQAADSAMKFVEEFWSIDSVFDLTLG
jgi:hypothetical protein